MSALTRSYYSYIYFYACVSLMWTTHVTHTRTPTIAISSFQPGPIFCSSATLAMSSITRTTVPGTWNGISTYIYTVQYIYNRSQNTYYIQYCAINVYYSVSTAHTDLDEDHRVEVEDRVIDVAHLHISIIIHSNDLPHITDTLGI